MYRTDCRFEVAGEIPIRDTTAAIHLYRIAQEALNNAIRHAKASRIVVRLTREAHRASISVEDDGKGIDPPHPDDPAFSPGMGLRIMGYRAKMIGGRLEVRRRPGGGTIVTCTCPLPAALRKGNATPFTHANLTHEQPPQQHLDLQQQQGQGAAR
jgi:signal transduction histidine kinase